VAPLAQKPITPDVNAKIAIQQTDWLSNYQHAALRAASYQLFPKPGSLKYSLFEPFNSLKRLAQTNL